LSSARTLNAPVSTLNLGSIVSIYLFPHEFSSYTSYKHIYTLNKNKIAHRAYSTTNQPIRVPLIAIMAGATAKTRLQALSKQLVEGIPVEPEFEGLPGIRHVAEMPAGERVKGKVIIITGTE
jgi:hypothetical protein